MSELYNDHEEVVNEEVNKKTKEQHSGDLNVTGGRLCQSCVDVVYASEHYVWCHVLVFNVIDFGRIRRISLYPIQIVYVIKYIDMRIRTA